MNKPIAATLLALGGCSTAISYSPWKDGDNVQSNALKFELQDSAITLATPSPVTPSGTGSASPAPPKSNCPKDVTHKNWWTCFNQVTPRAAMAPQDPASSKIYVATPDNAARLDFETTTVAGVPVAGQDALYSKVTVTYTSNASKIIAGAGSGAVTGFGIAGPYGAAAGFVIGAGAGALGVGAAAAPPPPGTPALVPAAPSLSDYLCKETNSNKVTVDLSKATAQKLTPSVSFPVTIGAADARPLATLSDIQSSTRSDAACWHQLPNAQNLATISPSPANVAPSVGPSTRDPALGDGWLYRLYTSDNPTQAPAGTVPTQTYFANSGSRQDFPYSSCRKVTMQITWWKELADAIAKMNTGGVPAPQAVDFATVVADPTFVSIANVKKGGVINFKPDCGAYVSADIDTSYGADINAIVTDTQNIYKAEQTWANSKATTSQKKQ